MLCIHLRNEYEKKGKLQLAKQHQKVFNLSNGMELNFTLITEETDGPKTLEAFVYIDNILPAKHDINSNTHKH